MYPNSTGISRDNVNLCTCPPPTPPSYSVNLLSVVVCTHVTSWERDSMQSFTHFIRVDNRVTDIRGTLCLERMPFCLRSAHLTSSTFNCLPSRLSGVRCSVIGQGTMLKKPPCPESASELYRQSDRRLSPKLAPTFADRGCQVVSVTDLYCRFLYFLQAECRKFDS
jgi:hypothetical protein